MSAARRLLLAASAGGPGGFILEDPMAGLGWFNVKSYGAVGDGSTDDTAAIDAAIAAWNSAGAGVLYVPHGTYKVTAGLTTITAGGTILGDGEGTWSWTDEAVIGMASLIQCTSATAELFVVTSQAVTFESIALENTSAYGTASAGAAIRSSATDYHQKVDLRDVLIVGFYIGFDCRVNAFTYVGNTVILNSVLYGMKVQNTVEHDSGGLVFIGSSINSADATICQAGIRIESSGGNKVVGSTINGMAGHAIEIHASAGSSILLVSGCSIEAYLGDGIHVDANGHIYDLVNVTGCEINQGTGNTSGHALYTTGVNEVIIGNCNLRADSGTAVSLNSGTKAVVGPFTNSGFGTLLATSSFTSVINHTT